ncbi:MAG: hypothetical protein HC844_11635 [Tabrizicola sp.]|nr:hypothetical protein [Tabrizicola sp.]
MPKLDMIAATRAGLLPAALGLAVVLGGCISDDQAVDLGIATQCDADGTVAKLGDPAGRYATRSNVEICKGRKRDAYNETSLDLIDCSATSTLQVGVIRQSADPARRGPDYDNAAAVETQKARLRAGITDLAGVEAALRGAGVPATLLPGQGAEQCGKLARQG